VWRKDISDSFKRGREFKISFLSKARASNELESRTRPTEKRGQLVGAVSGHWHIKGLNIGIVKLPSPDNLTASIRSRRESEHKKIIGK